MKTNTTLKNKYFFVILFLEEIYLGKIMCLLSIRTLSKFLWRLAQIQKCVVTLLIARG